MGYTKQMVAEACALDDEVRDRYTQFEARNAERASRRMIYKEYEGEQPALQQPAPDVVTQQQLDMTVEVIGSECGELERRLKAEVAQLQDRILKLESMVEVLKGFVTNKVASLTSIKGGIDAA